MPCVARERLFYGPSEDLWNRRATSSGSSTTERHNSLVCCEALVYPEDKRNHRFFPMAKEVLFPPAGRSDLYTIIEIVIITGRSIETRKHLVRLLFERIDSLVGIKPIDLEISILEIPAEKWGFRAQHGDETTLNYKINV
jgi:Tautomerase enzyme